MAQSPLNHTWYFRLRKYFVPIYTNKVKMTLKGQENIPDGACLFVGNHRSSIDHLLIWRALERPVPWVVAAWLQKLPLIGWLLHKSNVIFIGKRYGTQSFKEHIIELLRAGTSVGIFPEGGNYIERNDYTAPLADFHPGFAKFALDAGTPIQPFLIIPIEEEIANNPWPMWLRRARGESTERIKKIRNESTLKRIQLVFLPPIDTDGYMALSETDRVTTLVEDTRATMQEAWLSHMGKTTQ